MNELSQAIENVPKTMELVPIGKYNDSRRGRTMKIQSIINLVKYHVDGNDYSFRDEVSRIADELDKAGKGPVADYLMELITTADSFVPQIGDSQYTFFEKAPKKNEPLFLPKCIQDDLLGIARSCAKNLPISKILFFGKPGSGKTESTYQLARLLNRDLYIVKTEELVDSRLGQTAKNLVSLFKDISRLRSLNAIVLFDEIDSLVMKRLDKNDVREMGRVTSTFLKELEEVSDKVLIIATTNLLSSLDAALLRRFEAKISFDRYTEEDLLQVSDGILTSLLKKSAEKSDMRLFNKILKSSSPLPYPGEMRQLLKVALAFSDEGIGYDYLRRIYKELRDGEEPTLAALAKEGFTTREIEMLTGISKSSVSREMKELCHERTS